MLKKFFGAIIFTWLITFAQFASAMSFAVATDGAKDLPDKYYRRALANQVVGLEPRQNS